MNIWKKGTYGLLEILYTLELEEMWGLFPTNSSHRPYLQPYSSAYNRKGNFGIAQPITEYSDFE